MSDSKQIWHNSHGGGNFIHVRNLLAQWSVPLQMGRAYYLKLQCSSGMKVLILMMALSLEERGLSGRTFSHILGFVEEKGARKNGDESTNFSCNLCCTLCVPILHNSETNNENVIVTGTGTGTSSNFARKLRQLMSFS